MGSRPALPHRAARRRDRYAARLRSRDPALGRTRSTDRSCCRRASSRSTTPARGACARRCASASTSTRAAAPLYQDLKERRRAGRHRVLPAAVLRATPRPCSTTCPSDTPAGAGRRRAGRRPSSSWPQTSERYEQRRHDLERPILPPGELYLPPDELRERLNRRERVEVCGPLHPRATRPWPLAAAGADAAAGCARARSRRRRCGPSSRSYPGRVLLAADSPGRREALIDAAGQPTNIRPQVVDGWEAFRAGDVRFAIAVAALDGRLRAERPGAGGAHRAPAVPRARAPEPPPRASADRDPEAIIRDLGELTDGRADRARGPRRRSLSRPGDAGDRRHARRIPDHRIRQGRQALRAGRAAAI